MYNDLNKELIKAKIQNGEPITDFLLSIAKESFNKHKMIKLKQLHPDAILPTIGSEDAACYDLYALEDVQFKPGEIKLVKTGWAIEVPKGWRVNIYVRSSTPLKKGFVLANSVGIIDADYRGELGVQLMNIKMIQDSANSVGVLFDYSMWNMVVKGEKIAQFELVPHNPAKNFPIQVVETLSETNRGEGGFGSTGV